MSTSVPRKVRLFSVLQRLSGLSARQVRQKRRRRDIAVRELAAVDARAGDPVRFVEADAGGARRLGQAVARVEKERAVMVVLYHHPRLRERGLSEAGVRRGVAQ